MKTLKATFVRSSTGRAGTRVQEWRSETTGRVHQVLEANSDRLGADLTPGESGYLWFRWLLPAALLLAVLWQVLSVSRS